MTPLLKSKTVIARFSYKTSLDTIYYNPEIIVVFSVCISSKMALESRTIENFLKLC